MVDESGPRTAVIAGDIRVEILHLSDFRYDHLCIFKIVGRGIVRLYICHLSLDEAHLPTSDLLHLLLERVNTSYVALMDKFTVQILEP